jgi:hypothetical protein
MFFGLSHARRLVFSDPCVPLSNSKKKS